MSELIRCATCNGLKVILGMGGMKKQCTECNGVGWTKSQDVSLTDGTDGVSPSDVDQVKADLHKMIDAYEVLQKENAELKAKIESLKAKKLKKKSK